MSQGSYSRRHHYHYLQHFHLLMTLIEEFDSERKYAGMVVQTSSLVPSTTMTRSLKFQSSRQRCPIRCSTFLTMMTVADRKEKEKGKREMLRKGRES